ncbi:hypothetical protein EJ73_02891, partial [Hoylesella shahii DSM 15611 = JCM 12083]
MIRLPIDLEVPTKVLHIYGELFVDEHSSTEEMPYKFNGKEFDQETGLYAHYDAKEDFLEGMTTGLPLQKDGRVEINAPYKKDKTNDDVTLIIKRKDVHGENVVEKRTLPANAPATGVLTRSLDILEKDSVQLSFEIQTVGVLNWKKVEWTP